MEIHYIEYEGVEYKIPEPTIELWNQINTAKEFKDNKEFVIYLLSIVTGIPVDNLLDAEWESMYETSNYLAEYFLSTSEQFYNEFTFEGKTYRFIDLDRLTFGEFIDIDEFLSRPLLQRQKELNQLMALLYREVDINGNLTKYNGMEVEARAKTFKRLPVKYLRGAMRFFFHLDIILQKSTHSSSRLQMWRRIKITKTLLRAFGVGTQRLYIYLVRMYSNSIKWVRNHFWRY